MTCSLNSIPFSLKPPTDAIRSWEVQCEMAGVEGRKAAEIISRSGASAHTLTVGKGSQYRVRVAGRNVQGREYWSPYMMAETPVDRK